MKFRLANVSIAIWPMSLPVALIVARDPDIRKGAINASLLRSELKTGGSYVSGFGGS